MENEAWKLRIDIEKNSYYVHAIRIFKEYASMLKEDKEECFDFAYGMSFGNEGEHRASRSGGTIKRTPGQIFINTFQGKMAEFALYRFFQSKNICVEKPDTEKYDLGVWDSFDLTCQGKKISVKSTKEYGNLLLLETKDWNDNGEYIPNIDANGDANGGKYDYTILVRFSPDGEKIMAKKGLLYQHGECNRDALKKTLIKEIRDIDWEYDFPGFIFYSELVKMISDRCVIPKGAKLNGTTIMDAENYYFQAGNMHPLEELYTVNSDTEKMHSEDLLKRTCPRCGKSLIIRHGYNNFWGCTGFSTNGCTFKEPIES